MIPPEHGTGPPAADDAVSIRSKVEPGLVQEDLFANAIAAVNVLDSLQLDTSESAVNKASDIVLGLVEAANPNQPVDDGVSSTTSSTDDLEREQALGEVEHEDQNASPDGPKQPGSEVPLQRAKTQAKLQRSRTNSALTKNKSDGDDKVTMGDRCTALLKSVLLRVGKVFGFLWSEAKILLVLLPYAIGFVSRPEEPLRLEWEIWLLRPLYCVLLGRVASIIIFFILGNSVLAEVLPTRVVNLIDSFRGWPSTIVCWLALMAVAYFTPFFDAEAWQRLRQVQWLIAVQWWLAALAITRALLDASTASFFFNLKDGHFQERVDKALLTMRVLRMLFGTARVARARHAQRHGDLNTSSVSTVGRKMVSTVGKTVNEAARMANNVVRRGSNQGAGPHVPQPLSRDESELMITEDSFFVVTLNSLSDQLSMIQHAITSGQGFVSSVAEAKKRATHTFQSLLTEYENEIAMARDTGLAPPVDGGGPPRTIPRARLVRWCTKAARKKSSAFRRSVADCATSVLAYEHVGEAEFVKAVEDAYREQRFVSASVESFDALNKHVHSFLVAIWALVVGIAGIFLVDWGVEFDDWIVPISSSSLSIAFLLGWLPYETAAGILYVLSVRPYDIGDRILICNPGFSGAGAENFTVADIGLLSTRLVSWQGEEHVICNFLTRKLAVINLNRSRTPHVVMEFQVPASTPGAKVSELIDSIRAYVGQAPQDWVTVEFANIGVADMKTGLIKVTIGLLTTHGRLEDGLIDSAKTRIYMFVHVYMQQAGIEYVQPAQTVRAQMSTGAAAMKAWFA
mmetsp:Transcript_28815/g.84462  ORF Transcript_28815/g.84462 Transcript_28815/m.84462 type:complete len:797 (-) Transcript_28815:100-2490(-)